MKLDLASGVDIEIDIKLEHWLIGKKIGSKRIMDSGQLFQLLL